jgi:beta-glucosidase
VTFALPPGFRFGVATSGFQTEGGFNGPGEPANNWRDWERAGRVEPSGIALDFWNRYEEHLDRAAAAGCDAFRLSVEWARCEPVEGQVDDAAFDRYAAILAACADRGLEPVVSLHHYTHPVWLGPDFWLDLDAPERFATWAAVAVDRLAPRCRRWITINEINGYAVQTYVLGALPPGRRAANGELVRALDHMVSAHVAAYAAIHRRQPGAIVSTNSHVSSLYELDRLLTDVLVARSRGVTRPDLHAWLRRRRATHYAALPPPSAPDTVLRRLTASIVPLEQALPRAVAAVYTSPFPRPVDLVQIDYYDPVAAHHLTHLRRRPWHDAVDPAGLVAHLRANTEPGLSIEVAENGLCNRVRRGRSFPRPDGWDRVRHLRANLAALAGAIAAGVPVDGYFHWTLADCYEWGSYEPRFGLHAVDRERGLRWRPEDSMGGDAAGAYRELITAMRQGRPPEDPL